MVHIIQARRAHALQLRHQAGDTIVEVLIAIAIVSLVLTGAYATTHRNLVATRSAQEHSEALKLLQGQIDTLRAYNLDPANDTATNISKGQQFCVDTSGSSSKVVIPFTSPGQYPNICQPLASGGYPYRIAITYDKATNAYTLQAVWDSQSGPTNNVQLAYRL